jgi:hypothetical protein
MRQLFVDYAGDTVPVIIHPLTGKTRPARFAKRSACSALAAC